jgi:hypothetical protein
MVTDITKNFTKIMLIKDLVYRYSGAAFVTFPKGSVGYIIEDWNDVHWLPKEEIDECKALVHSCELIPVYLESKLICVSRYDYTEVEHGCAA